MPHPRDARALYPVRPPAARLAERQEQTVTRTRERDDALRAQELDGVVGIRGQHGQDPVWQNIQIQANGESNTIAIVAIVFAGLALMGALGGAWVPLFGLCNIILVIPAVILAYMSRSQIQHLEGHKDAGLVKAGWIISLVSLALTLLPQLFWLVMFLLAFGDAVDGVGADGWFDCGNGESIPGEWVNDGEWDCSNGADEN